MTTRAVNARVVVIGAGPAGIGAGLALGGRGTVLEGAPDPGGLCRTIEIDGALFDLGGHSFHTPHPHIRDLVFGALDMIEQRREARCHSHGVLIDYPFQSHFHDLPDAAVVEECDAGLRAARRVEEVASFEQFIELRYGAGIAKHFLRPYNRKLWRRDLATLAADWVGERVASAEPGADAFASSGGIRTPLQSDTRVAYPARGGYGEIYRALARRLPDLRLGRKVVGIDPARRRLTLEGGAELRWSRVVSTLPLDRLLTLVPDVPAPLAGEVARLETLSLALVFVIVDRPVETPIQRVYCADPLLPFHKLVISHNSSPSLRARPRHGIMAEVSYTGAAPAPDLEERTVTALARMGIVRSSDEVRGATVLEVPYAYPIPTHERGAVVGRAKAWLEGRGIHTLGRFGEWAYINSDEALHRGVELGRALAEAGD